MKKVIYGILAVILLVGVILICTIGLNVDMIYSKNTELDIYIGKECNEKDIKQIVAEVFPKEKIMVQKIEVFDDMVAITMKSKTEEELEGKLEELNTKINEKYEIENTVEDIEIAHNPKVRLSSLIKPYIVPMIIATAMILVYTMIRYRKIGVFKTLRNYVLTIGIVEALYLSILAITRIPVNRLVIPIGLTLYAITIIVLGFQNETKITQIAENKK